MASYFEPLVMAAVGMVSKILSSQQQMAVLDQTKTLTESALQMLYTAKEAGGNPKVLLQAKASMSRHSKRTRQGASAHWACLVVFPWASFPPYRRLTCRRPWKSRCR